MLTNLRVDAPALLAARSERDPVAGCLIWTAGTDWDGYGTLKVEGRSRRAHRIAYQAANGWPDITGVVIRHDCDTPPCIEPTHLRPGTTADNNADRQSRGRSDDRRGERCPTARLTWQQVASIRELLATGRTHASLGAEFGVSRRAISKIASNETWQLTRAC